MSVSGIAWIPRKKNKNRSSAAAERDIEPAAKKLKTTDEKQERQKIVAESSTIKTEVKIDKSTERKKRSDVLKPQAAKEKHNPKQQAAGDAVSVIARTSSAGDVPLAVTQPRESLARPTTPPIARSSSGAGENTTTTPAPTPLARASSKAADSSLVLVLSLSQPQEPVKADSAPSDSLSPRRMNGGGGWTPEHVPKTDTDSQKPLSLEYQASQPGPELSQHVRRSQSGSPLTAGARNSPAATTPTASQLSFESKDAAPKTKLDFEPTQQDGVIETSSLSPLPYWRPSYKR